MIFIIYYLFLFCLFVLTQSLQDGPTNVVVDLYVESFGNIEEADMVSSAQHLFFLSEYLNLILPSYCLPMDRFQSRE